MSQLVTRNVNDVIEKKATFGDHVADAVASGMGSWRFIIAQTVFVIFWMILNVIGLIKHWDAYPFILLNLLFSTQAAYAAPIIMMSQNRQAEKDRLEAELDYQTNKRAELEIIDMQKDLANLQHRLDKAQFDVLHDHLEQIKVVLGLPETKLDDDLQKEGLTSTS